MRQRKQVGDAVFALGVTALAALLVWPLLRIGWVPNDEGTLAQSAFRVYNGQLPHRDFAEIYTGGLAMWDALAFHVFGVNLFSLRLAVFTAFLLWVPATYWIARRWLSPVWAATAALTAVAWSYPNYVAGMPSWYNLFFATWGVAALLRFVETHGRKWLVLAGACAGASLLVKVTGLYFVAAAMLFFLWREQEEEPRTGGWAYTGTCGLGLMAYLAALLRLLGPRARSGELYAFLLPSAACVALWFWRERTHNGAASSQRFANLAATAGPFLGGVAGVVGLFVAWYARCGAVHALAQGVFGSAGKRVSELAGRVTMPPVGHAAYALVLVGLAIFALRSQFAGRRWVIAGTALMLAAVVAVSAWLPGLQDTWIMLGMATPLVVCVGVWRVGKGEMRGDAAARVFLLVAAATVCSLVQFPVSYVTYFCYAAPLLLLAATGVVDGQRKTLQGVLLLFLLAFGWLGMVTKHVYDPALRLATARPLTLERGGGLRVDDSQTHYGKLVPFLQAHSSNGYLYAGNDCPQLYFLTGLKDITRDDTGATPSEVLAALQTGQLHLVVLNEESFFAASSIPENVRSAVKKKLPNRTRMGNFSIFWD